MVDLLILVTSQTYYSLTFRKRPTKMRRFSGRLREVEVSVNTNYALSGPLQGNEARETSKAVM